MAMEFSSLDECEYKVHHFFRNKCSNVLAELFTRELRNSKYVKESLERNREDTLSKSLFKLLKNVSSKGRRKGKCTTEGPSCSSKTQHLNNLKYNEEALGHIQVRQLLLEECGADAAVERLSTLDSAFLLWILTNDILEIPLNPGVIEALDTLREIRNSIYHRDSNKNNSKSVPELLHMLCTNTKFLCKYLGKDDTCFQNYVSHTQNSFCPVFREVQQEIHKSCFNVILSKHFYHATEQPTIKHLRGYCRPDEIVENLMKFLAENQVCVSEEPRPVLLCGAPGAGKSSILHSLVLNVICEEQSGSGSFPLVVMVDEADTKNRTREKFWECLFQRLAGLCPQAEHKYGLEEVVNVLSSYSSRSSFLFLIDQNLQDTKSLNHLMPHMDRGTWVLSYQGVPEPSTLYRVLKVESLSEGQVHQLLWRITKSEEQCSLVSQLYRTCNYKGLINTPEMVCIFAKVCIEIKDYVPFFRLIQIYIYKNIDATDENERELVKLGRKAFDVIRQNKKYYLETSLTDIENSVWVLFLEHDPSKGFFFKYRVVEDYLAAKYIVKETKEACEMWLKQATLFRRVFEIMCALWCEQEDGIRINLPYIRKYLEKLFEIVPPKRRKGKKKRGEPMETDQTHCYDDDDATCHNNFVRWVFLSKMAKDYQNNQDILLLLAELLACKQAWLFKCKSLTEKCIENLSLVFRHVNLTKELTIKLVSGPNVTMLTKLWGMLSNHQGVCSNTTVQLVIHHTETNWIMHEKLLALFPATIVQTTSPLYITKYVGPLLCSGTEQFFKCLCMKKLDVLDVYVCDLGSLREVLAHRQVLRSCIVRLNLRVEEMKIPNTIKIKLSSSILLNLTITYFEGLQALLDRIEPPHRLSCLRIYRVYIHENFRLDLSRFTRLKLLSIRFLHVGRLPSVYLEIPQSEEKMEVDDIKNNRKVSWLPLEQWTLHLMLYLHLPACLERLLLRNLSFCNDSNVLILNRYWVGLPYQRLVLLDTHISMSMFKEILRSLISDSKVDAIRNAIEKKCRLEELPESVENAVKQERLGRQVREKRRQNKPEGKEVIITSDAKLCRECHLFSCTCMQPSINQNRDTYQDFITLVNDIYSYEILSISYSNKDIILRKDMCGDLHVQCPLAFLNDEMVQQLKLAQHPELVQGHKDCQKLQKLSQVLGALALAQAISLTHTFLSHEGALCLVQHIKKKKEHFGRIEPFRLTIFSRHYHTYSKSVEEVQDSPFTREVKNDDSLQQFNFRCDCMKRCHNFKKSIKGKIYFNDELFVDR